MQITELSGPATALSAAALPEPEPSHFMTPGEGVVIEVEAAGVSFPEVLQTRGEYQMKPELPFVPGSEVAGTVHASSEGSPFQPGDRVCGFCVLGGFAELAVAPLAMTFALPDELDFAQGAALVLNYHTAYFSLVTRGGLSEGETVLVHGAAGGVGTATLQVAKGLGARTIAVVSSDEKEAVVRDLGADEVVRADRSWKDDTRELTGGQGVDVIVDPVGGDRFTDSLRSLGRGGRLVVVGFTAGSIPEVKVNRLLLGNTSVVGAAWGEYLIGGQLAYGKVAGEEIAKLVAGGHVKPLVGARFPLESASQALQLIDDRGATGKVVLEP